MGYTEKRIIRGVWLGSSAANTPSLASLYRWAGRVIGAAAYHFFQALLNKGADHTNNLLHLRQEWRGQFDSIDIHAVHATRAPLPSKP